MFSQLQVLHQAPRRFVGYADMAHFACFDQISQYLQGFENRGFHIAGEC